MHVGSSGPDNSLVHVTGMDQSMDLNLIQLYFGNTKYSGGGTCTIRDDQRHQRQAYVILSFEDPEGGLCLQAVWSSVGAGWR